VGSGRRTSSETQSEVLERRQRLAPERRRRRGDDERGAALVEFALILMLFFLMIFGMIEFGVDYNNYISVRNGAREGARLGVVNDVNNAPSCKIAGITVTPPAIATGSKTDATNALICKTKSRIGLGNSVKIQVVAGASPGDSLQICASYAVNSVTGLVAPFVAGKVLQTSVTMRLEQTPTFQNYVGEGTVC
jgi:Flp pilus assembly protein TadG